MRESTRYGLWKANGMRCLYCGHLVQYGELEIDHIIPACTGDTELERLRLTLGLGAEFYLGDTRNLAPAHHDCNRKKADTQFNEAALGFYLGTWAKKQDKLRQEL
jgi:5-methylcytosine-specific restriction endonuclease McrA